MDTAKRSATIIAAITAFLSICCSTPGAAAQEFEPESREQSTPNPSEALDFFAAISTPVQH
ncbi:hypothetical protein [Cutibacterium sp.]|uniref:hypothetical protein n=1 Tax=Cutibacterium sp. TaxID=1912221 RepID=UPI0026DDB742|nr:hypothetical protein [Cutibacterium sp.]MDO4412608.1 hypothetical protein [Cutibacterium sp.]